MMSAITCIRNKSGKVYMSVKNCLTGGGFIQTLLFSPTPMPTYAYNTPPFVLALCIKTKSTEPIPSAWQHLAILVTIQLSLFRCCYNSIYSAYQMEN